MTIYIGEIPIHYVSSFDTDRSLKSIEEIHFLGIDSIPYLSEQASNIRDFGMVGTLLQDSGVIPTIDDMAEDILALKDRRSQFNYIHDFQNRTGWLGIKDAGSDKNASSLVTRPYVMSGKFLPKALYQTRMHSNPIIRPNDFSFALGTDDCDNYIAIPIGATYLGGDGSAITRTSKDGDITLVLATTDNNIKWDINEADVLNGECKVFDEMSSKAFTDDITSGMTFSASNELSSTYNAAKAFDDNTGTYWHTGSIPSAGEWIKVDFGASNTKDIEKLTLKNKGGNGFNSFKLQGSNNDSDWDDIYSGSAANNEDVQTFTFSNGTFYRYYRVYCVTGYDANRLDVTEIEMMEYSLSESSWVQVYARDREFTGDIVIENGLYRVLFDASTEYMTIYYWSGSAYNKIDSFTAGTYTRTTIVELNPDIVRVKLDSGVDIELRRGHPPMIDTDTTDLLCVILTPADQSTSTENYLSLGTNLYICSDESFSIVNATQNLDDGKKWIFRETVSATAEDIAHQAMVNARENRELIQR